MEISCLWKSSPLCSRSQILPHLPPLNSTVTVKLPPLALSSEPHRLLFLKPTAFLRPNLIGITSSAIFFFGFGLRFCTAAPPPLYPPSLPVHSLQDQVDEQKDEKKVEEEEEEKEKEDEELKAAFEAWKSKTFALTVPLRITALQGSIPPSWVKDFIRSQGKRLKLETKFRATFEDIFSDLFSSFDSRKIGPSSALAADIVSFGDSWVSFAIKKSLVEPVRGAEEQDWFKELSARWKVYLRRNCNGDIDPEGEIWAVPYRWGSMVIAYKKSKFEKHKLAPIEDWQDLWRPELEGRISMVNSSREVIGAVLKYMGASYNTTDIETQVTGGRNAVLQNLVKLGKQVKLFDSMHFLKAFAVGDVWVAVGWSSDVIPIAKRMSNVAVVVPKSGTSLWADLWAIPAASRVETDQIGGRVRGPSPLIHQWMEFCLQAARAIPFKQGVIAGASPSALENPFVELPKELSRAKPKLETNLVAGIPPAEVLAKCEFLEPLSDATMSDYKWLLDNMPKKTGTGFPHLIEDYLLKVMKTWRVKQT